MGIRFVIAKGLKKILHPPALRKCLLSDDSHVGSKSELNYVSTGKYTYIGNDCFMVNVQIGSFCSIADRVCVGGARHPLDRVSTSPVFHEGKNALKKVFYQHSSLDTPKTIIGNDVWIGMGVIVMAGVTISDGAVIGSGSIVTHDVPSYEIWAGNPAKKIRKRFSDDIIEQMNKICWWNWSNEKIENYSPFFDNPKILIEKMEENGDL